MRLLPLLLALLVLIGLFQGCATRDVNLVDRNYEAADALIIEAGASLDKNKPILVATIMDVADLSKTSRFGRITADMLAGRLAQQGYTVLEIKLDRDNLYTLTGTGETLLSDELRNLSASCGAQAVLIGTYAPAAEQVYVSAKLVRASDNVIIAAENYRMPQGTGIAALIDPDSVLRTVGSWY